MRFLVTFAIDAEFNPWKARHPFVPYEYDNSGRKREFDMYRANISARGYGAADRDGTGKRFAGDAHRAAGKL